MSGASGQDIPGAESVILESGTVLAGRFRVENYMGVDIIGDSYLAHDEKEDRRVTVSIIPSRFLRGANLVEKIKSEIKSASQAVHKNILTCYGMGTLPAGELYITSQYIEGQKLYSILTKRRDSGKLFSLRGAYNIIAHVCNGMAEVHKTRIHGSLSPFSIRISSAGRVKIGDLPLSRLFYMFPAMRKEIPEYVQKFWAPEVTKIGSFVTERADIFSVGVVLFELLTGVLPDEENRSIKAFRPELPEGIDDLIMRCIDTDPTSRWNNMQALGKALLSVTEELDRAEAAPKEKEQDDDLLMDLEIDIDKPLRAGPPPPPPALKKKEAPAPAPFEMPAAPGPQPEQAGGVAAILDAVDSQAPGPPADQEPERPAGGASEISLDDIVASLEDQDAEKWMVTKDGMDHGPFRTREVIQMVLRWEVEGQHMIMDLDSGLRVKFRESEQFKELIERAKVEKQRKEEIEALEKSEKAEKRGGVAKVFIVIAVLGGIGIIVGGFFLTRAAVQAFSGGGEEVDLAENIKIDVGKGGILKDGGKKGKGGKRKGGGGIPAGMTYEEYMAMGVELGDLAGDGGQTQLTQGQINATMSSQGKKIYPCIYAELKRDKSLKRVSLKFAIEGSTGRVQGVSVTSGGSSEFKSCVAGKMKGIKFPTFGAPRMGATFFFDVN